MRIGARAWLTGVVAVSALAACGGATPTESDSTEEAPPPAAAAPSSASEPPWTTLTGELARCGPQPPTVQDAAFEPLTLEDADVGSIPAVRLGTGRAALVLLHQTDGNGLCGWLPFLPVAAGAGYSTIAIDLCRYGAQCRAVEDGTFTDADQTDPVAVAVRYARTELGARKVVVVGASMGGSIALMSAVQIKGLTAVVDLSGPLDWPGVELAEDGAALPVPALVAMAASEGDDPVAGARALAERAPAGSEFLAPDSGHGWDLVTDPFGAPTPLAAEVLDWLAGQTA